MKSHILVMQAICTWDDSLSNTTVIQLAYFDGFVLVFLNGNVHQHLMYILGNISPNILYPNIAKKQNKLNNLASFLGT
jgi:hypothetical protein